MIEIRELSVDLGEFKLRDIDLSIGDGEYLVVMGPSGAGKTVLLQTILGIVRPIRGRIMVDNVDVTDLPPERRGLSYVPQNYALFPHMTVLENIAFGLRLRGYNEGEIIRKVKTFAEILGIENLLHRNPTTLSGGEQQRVALARALVVDPRAILLDEPLSALDKSKRIELQSFLRRLHSELGFTAIHVTHDYLEASLLADRIAVMFDGRIFRVASFQELIEDPGDEKIVEFMGMDNVLRGRAEKMKEGLSKVRVSDLELVTAYEAEGDIVLVIRPEDIYIHPLGQLTPMSARNVFRGVVESVEFRSPVHVVTFRVGEVRLRSVITRQALEELGIEPKKEFLLSVKATAVKVISQ